MYTIIGADGKEYGPVPADKVRDWLANGRANSDTRIKAVDSTTWTTIGALPEFGAGAPASASAAPAPAAMVPVAGGSPFTAPIAVAAGGTFEPADRGSRLLAAILDSFIGFGFMLPGLIVLMVAGVFAEQGGEPAPVPLIAGMGLIGLGALALVIIQFWLLSTRGQTMGKKIMSVRIVKHADYSNPGFVHAVLLRAIVNGAIGAIPIVGGIYTLVDILFIFREDRRCIHDLIAGTLVVKA